MSTGRRARRAAVRGAFAVLLGFGVGACGGADEGPDPATVYVSLPLRGAEGADGRDAADGARQALADAGRRAGTRRVRIEILDDTAARPGGARWDPATVAENARTAARDTDAIAYLGELSSAATRLSLPITNAAGLLQVSPGAGAEDLVREPGTFEGVPEQAQPSGARSFGRVIPSDLAQATAGADWARARGGRRATVVVDGSEFGRAVAEAFSQQALAAGIEIERERLARRLERLGARGRAVAELCAEIPSRPRAPAAPDLVYFAGEDQRGLGLACLADAGLRTTLATDALLADAQRLGDVVWGDVHLTSAALDPAHLPPAGRRFAERFRARHGREPGRYAAYGYEAMAVILDAIRRAGRGSRGEVVDAFFATADRDSVLGAYSIDGTGETTLARMSGYRIEDGQPAPAAELGAP